VASWMWCSKVWQKVPCYLHLQGTRISCTRYTVTGIGIVSTALLTYFLLTQKVRPSPHYPYTTTILTFHVCVTFLSRGRSKQDTQNNGNFLSNSMMCHFPEGTVLHTQSGVQFPYFLYIMLPFEQCIFTNV
jgi:hypothetical protein